MTMTNSISGAKCSEAEGKARRRSRFVASLAAVRQIGATLASKELKTRKADEVTNVLAICSVLAATALFLFPGQTGPLVAICDILIGLAILFYVTQRLGIFVTFNERQTLLTAELLFGIMLGTGFVLCNVGLILILLKQMVSSFGHPT